MDISYKDMLGVHERHFFGLFYSQVLHVGSQYSQVVPVSVVNPTGQTSTQLLSYLFSLRGNLQDVQVYAVVKQLKQLLLHYEQVP